jgi:hypothetical protein
MGDYSDEENYEDEFPVDADLPNLRGHGKFDDTMEEGSDISSSSEIPAQHSHATIPEVVKTFVANLFAQIRQQNATEIHHLYENHFNRITEKFFKQTAWPQVDAIQALPHPDTPNKLLVTPEKGIHCIYFSISSPQYLFPFLCLFSHCVSLLYEYNN